MLEAPGFHPLWCLAAQRKGMVIYMKKIINSPETMVREMCRGMVSAYPQLEFLSKYKIVKKRDIDHSKVSLVSGGGSGHEPAHAGFVGKGLLDAAVCGDIFASPTQVQVYHALKEIQSSKGILMIVKNYSGDIMNFTNAAAMAREEGITVDFVKVEDDIAVNDSLYTVGRRGVAGTIFVHKIAGAAAEEGKSLSEVKVLAQEAANNTRSLGFALTSCVVPAKGSPTFDITDSEMEFGVGIHGEPGRSRESLQSADDLAHRIINDLAQDLDLRGGDEVAMLVNGFGGSPLQELYVLSNSAVNELTSRGITLHRIFTGNFMTSIDMAGASISLLKLNPILKKYLDLPCEAPALNIKGQQKPVIEPQYSEENIKPNYGLMTDSADSVIKNDVFSAGTIIRMVDYMGTFIIDNEVPFCELDSHAGDGDFGMSISKGFKQVKKEWQSLIEAGSDIGQFLQATAFVLMEHCGGASGPIWGSAFRAAGLYAAGKTHLDRQEFSDLLQAAVKGIQTTGERSFGRGAVVGDKTLIDALVPCADTWSSGSTKSLTEMLSLAASAAEEGAEKTKEIVARMGRAGTVGERSLGYPDAGAYALGCIFKSIATEFKAE